MTNLFSLYYLGYYLRKTIVRPEINSFSRFEVIVKIVRSRQYKIRTFPLNFEEKLNRGHAFLNLF